jgi:hypothetical protein
MHQGRWLIYLRINNFLIPLRFHRKVSDVPFTRVPPCSKKTDLLHARGLGVAERKVGFTKEVKSPEGAE